MLDDDQFMSSSLIVTFQTKKSCQEWNRRIHQQIHTNLLMKGHCHFKLINQRQQYRLGQLAKHVLASVMTGWVSITELPSQVIIYILAPSTGDDVFPRVLHQESQNCRILLFVVTKELLNCFVLWPFKADTRSQWQQQRPDEEEASGSKSQPTIEHFGMANTTCYINGTQHFRVTGGVELYKNELLINLT